MKLCLAIGLLVASLGASALAQPAPSSGAPTAAGPPVGAPLAAPPATAGPPPPMLLFVSPCGRPYRVRMSEPYPVAVWFAGADADKDGKLTAAEMRADAAIFFKALDQDRNGMIENPEIIFYEHRVLPEMLRDFKAAAAEPAFPLIQAQFQNSQPSGRSAPQMGDSHLERKAPPNPFKSINMQGAAPYGLLQEPEPVTAADSDFNRRITAQEFEAASNRRFKALDKDGDGFLTLATLPQTFVQNQMLKGKKAPRGLPDAIGA